VSRTADYLVIGGGLHGLSAALQAARRGVGVTLIERDFLGSQASGATAAGVRTLGRDPAELPLSLEAAQTWRTIADLVGDDCGFRPCGQLQVAEDEVALARIAARVRNLQARGLQHEQLLDATELRRAQPGLAPHCLGAAWAEGDGAANPHRTIRAFRDAAVRAGVRIVQRCPVAALSREGSTWRVQAPQGIFTAPMVLNAAGAWAARIAAMAGEELSQSIRTSMMIVTERTAPRVAPVVSSMARRLSFKQSAEGTLLIGGGTQGRLADDCNSASVDALALAEAAQAATRLFPWTRGLRIVRAWAGMEAQTADQLPVLGPSTMHEGLIHAFGFSGHGFQLVPSVGRALAALAAGEIPDQDLAAFSPARVLPRRLAA
jgi:glycine/D-amino acid oxidase-like deaminating enzyme